MKKQIVTLTAFCLAMFSASAQQEGKDSSQPAAAAKPVEKQASPAGQAAPKGKPTIVKVTPKPSKLFTALDVDLDGYISLSEIEAAVQVLKNLDANQDGQLTINEFELTEEPEKKISRVVVRPGAPGKPPAVGRPTRPGRRPTAKPTRPGARPKRVATAKRPSTKPTRPGAKSRPARRPGRPVASKATKPAAGASNQVSSTTARKPATPSRVVKSTSARRKPKSASRVKPGGVAIKNPQKPTAPDATTGAKEELMALVDETREVTAKLKESAGAIKDRNKKQSVLQWIRTDSRELMETLNTALRAAKPGQDQGAVIEEVRQSLTKARQLVE